MRRVNELISEYDPSNETDRNKIFIIKWFQKHPGERFDRMEVTEKLGDELGVGQGRVGQLLKSLKDDSKLEAHGEQRIAYQLPEDVIIPAKYQAIAGLRYLGGIFDIKRWGLVTFFVYISTLWAFLTAPFWVLTSLLYVVPQNSIGPISEYEFLVLTFSMTFWLVVFMIISYTLSRARRYWVEKQSSG